MGSKWSRSPVGAVAGGAHVVLHAGALGERTHHRELQGILERDGAHAAQAALDRVVVHHGVHDDLVVGLRMLSSLSQMALQLGILDVVRETAHDEDRQDDAAAAGALEDVEDVLAQAPAVVEQRLEAERVGQKPQPQQVRVDARELLEDVAQVLHAAGHLDAQQLLGGAHVAVAVPVAADAAGALGDVDELVEVALLGELLQTAVHVADLRDGLDAPSHPRPPGRGGWAPAAPGAAGRTG